MSFYRGGIDVVRSNALLYRGIFGFWPPSKFGGQLWDWTTLTLCRALRQSLRPGASFLDLGTGPVAVLAIYAKRRLHAAQVAAVDHVPELVASARRAVEQTRTDIALLVGDLFSEVRGRFSVIAFNAPYIDHGSGVRLSIFTDQKCVERWSGGADGCRVIERFLCQAGAYLETGGIILLGVNWFYVSDHAIRTLIDAAGFRVERIWCNHLSRSVVYACCASQSETEIELSAKDVED